MSYNSEHHSLHTYHSEEKDFTPPQSSSQQQNEAVIVGENHRLTKENKELWTCLKLMRENSELETASLISSVIAWCDDKFKRRFLELNSALSRQNGHPQSSFRPISPAKSPVLDIYKHLTSTSKGVSETGSDTSRSSVASGSRSPQSKILKSPLTGSLHGSNVSSGIPPSYQLENIPKYSQETSPRGSPIQSYQFISPQSPGTLSLSFHRQDAPSPTQGSVYDIVETEVLCSIRRTDAPSPTQGNIYDSYFNEPPLSSSSQNRALKDTKVQGGQSPPKSPRSITPVSLKDINLPTQTITKKDEIRKSPIAETQRTTSPRSGILKGVKDKPKSIEKQSSKGFLPAVEKHSSVPKLPTKSLPPQRITSTQSPPPKSMSPIIKETVNMDSTLYPKSLTSMHQDSGFGTSMEQPSIITNASQHKPEHKRTIISPKNLESKEARDQYIQSLIGDRQKSPPPVSGAINRDSMVSPSNRSSGAKISDSYSRYPSTLNSDALQSDVQSKNMLSARELKSPNRDFKTSSQIKDLRVSPPIRDLKVSLASSIMSDSNQTSGKPLTLGDLSVIATGDLSFGSSKESTISQAKDVAPLSPTHGSSTFVPKLDGTERVPTPFPLDLKTVQTTDDSSVSSFGEPLIHSTPKKETKKKVRISPIPEHFEHEEPSFREPSNKDLSFTDDSSVSSFGVPHAHSTPIKEPRKTVGMSVFGEEGISFKKFSSPVEKDFVASGSVSISSSVKQQSFRPSHRLLGEIAFQLERRILDYIFAKRIKGEKERLHRRFYGYTVSNIPSMMVRESTLKNGQVDLEKKVSFQYRFDYIIKSLLTFGYIMEKHSQFSLKMINKYGLLTHPPDRKTVEAFGLHDPSSLRLFVTKLSTSEKERINMMILLECLLFMAHGDGQAVFLW